MSGIAPVDRVGVVIPVLRDDSAHHPHGGTDPDGRNRPGEHQPPAVKEDESPAAEKPPASPHSPFGRIVNTFAMCARRGGAQRQRRTNRLSFGRSQSVQRTHACAAGNQRAPRSRENTGREDYRTQAIA